MNKKEKFLEYPEESVVKFLAQSEHFSTFGVIIWKLQVFPLPDPTLSAASYTLKLLISLISCK
jgi:hypothetical protein